MCVQCMHFFFLNSRVEVSGAGKPLDTIVIVTYRWCIISKVVKYLSRFENFIALMIIITRRTLFGNNCNKLFLLLYVQKYINILFNRCLKSEYKIITVNPGDFNTTINDIPYELLKPCLSTFQTVCITPRKKG